MNVWRVILGFLPFKRGIRGGVCAPILTTSNFATRALMYGGLACSLGIALAGCDRKVANDPLVHLPRNSYPTGIDYWPERKMLLFSEYSGGIYGIQENGTVASKWTDVGASLCVPTIRLRIDGARSRVWAMSETGVCIHDLHSRRLLAQLSAGEVSQHRVDNGLSDIALDADGHAYVIETGINPNIHRIDAVSFWTTEWYISPKRSGARSPRNFPANAIAVSPHNGSVLYFNAFDGTLHAVEMKTRERSDFVLERNLYGINALVVGHPLDPSGGMTLYALSASSNSVNILDLAAGLKTANIRGYATKHLESPLSGTSKNGELIVTNSQLLRHADFNAGRSPEHPYTLARLGTKYFAEHFRKLPLGAMLEQ